MKTASKKVCIIIFSLLVLAGCKKKQPEQKISEPLLPDSEQKIVFDDEDTVNKSDIPLENQAPVENQEPVLSQQQEAEIQELTEEIETIEQTNAENNIPQEEKEDFYVTDSNGKLKIFTFQEEVLLPVKEEDFTVITSVNKKIVERKFYDQAFRFVKKEEWSIPDIENAKLLKTILYTYENESYFPSEKNIITENNHTLIKYNSDSNPVETKEWIIVPADEKSASFEVLISESDSAFDDEKRLVLQNIKEYEYSDSSYKKLLNTQNKKMTYVYNNGGDIPADYKYYENKELRLYRKYTSEKGNYSEQVYFDDGYSVRTVYENNFKKKEIYTVNGNVVREVDYE